MASSSALLKPPLTRPLYHRPFAYPGAGEAASSVTELGGSASVPPAPAPGGLNELTWFTVYGYVYDIEQPNPAGTTIQPFVNNVSAYIDFFPGYETEVFPAGFAVLVADLDHGDGTSGDTMVPIAPITARLTNGAVTSIVVGDPIGVELLADTPILNLDGPLFYHVRWRNVTYGGAPQAISNFAFQAPTFNTNLSITSPALVTYPYYGP